MKKREDEIIKSLNYTRCSKEYNIVKRSVFDGNLINIIVVKKIAIIVQKKQDVVIKRNIEQ